MTMPITHGMIVARLGSPSAPFGFVEEALGFVFCHSYYPDWPEHALRALADVAYLRHRLLMSGGIAPDTQLAKDAIDAVGVLMEAALPDKWSVLVLPDGLLMIVDKEQLPDV